MHVAPFAGFSEETFSFLRGLASHNDKAWFEAHRADYDTHYVGAGRMFVEAMGPRLKELSPQVQFAARINGSISRINRDTRFSKDKSPYKDHLDLWFWHGDKRGFDVPGFYLRLTAETVFLGVGMYMFPKPMLTRYRELVSDPKLAGDVKAILDGIAASGPYAVAGPTRKAPPRGMAAEGISAEMLRYEVLNASLEWDSEVARDAGFLDFCFGHWRKCWPIGRWTLDNVWR